MLVLARKRGRSVHVGDGIQIIVERCGPSPALVHLIVPYGTVPCFDEVWGSQYLRREGGSVHYRVEMLFHDRIRIGDDIEIMLVDQRRYRVRFGITAPVEVAIHRDEVYARHRFEIASAVTGDNAGSERIAAT
jgi:carbon storage regulator CsrA